MEVRVLSYGETLWDMLPEGPVLGGAPCNLACRVNELGNTAVLVSRVGEDNLGRKALAQMEQLGLDTAHVQRDPEHPTGVVNITLDEDRQPDYDIVKEVAYDYIEITEALLEEARKASCIAFGTLSQRHPVSRATLIPVLDAAEGALKFLDVNLREECYTLETVDAALRRADIVKLNEQESLQLAEAYCNVKDQDATTAAAALLDHYALQHVVVTMSENGASCVSFGGDIVRHPGYKTEMVDACGAGDAFSAGFLDQFLKGAPPAQCIAYGNALGALTAAQHGATQRLDLDQINDLQVNA